MLTIIKDSYFDYFRMGFGNLIQEYGSLTNKVMESVENDCEME